MVYSRLVNIPMNRLDFENEKQLIIDIANFNVFDKETNLKLIKKQEWKHQKYQYFNTKQFKKVIKEQLQYSYHTSQIKSQKSLENMILIKCHQDITIK